MIQDFESLKDEIENVITVITSLLINLAVVSSFSCLKSLCLNGLKLHHLDLGPL